MSSDTLQQIEKCDIKRGLQKSDSGLYRGEIGASDNLLSIEYNLSVLGAFLV